MRSHGAGSFSTVRELDTFRFDFDPLFGHPIENVDCIESLFVGTASAENDYTIILRVVAHGAVGALGGDVAGGLDFTPLHSGGVE